MDKNPDTYGENLSVPRIYNFSAGPAMLPEIVLERAKEDLLDWNGSGMSVMEMSHRGKEFISIAEGAEANLRKLMEIPNTYKVLFLQGGASLQFAAVPLNLCGPKDRVDYVDTGHWSGRAIKEAWRFCDVNVAASGKDGGYMGIPEESSWEKSPSAAYLHYTPNETIGGVEFHWIPQNGDTPLVVDMSSNILSRPIDVSRFGVIYAGAQKNIGPAGVTIVIVREDLMGRAREQAPSVLNYKTQGEADSMSNTPPAFAWYMAGLVFEWLLEQGGLVAIADRNRRKADKLYTTIDASEFYANPVDPKYRSKMNVPFTLINPKLDDTFLSKAAAIGLKTLKGHRSVGGMRASIYNAMPEAGIDTLVEFMRDFERSYG
uniref:Phosphoserine aminotransferase n=1 Tax=Candidatus Kentrum eta TaxID=2126337 RepID=A0A450V1J3_9GAMM|nr:MAG: phosphoserine aminotransferase apoenzyme [Candidatus Kentron sp. H]VFJ98790.1 MAG: phosphoserine aminotransferase apoenzyme [Candidatus Kentron sp. H]VFK03605.1 MAG: phosphoserine aminotransferase apoenzyme [Candidatus Kentron sp. H]